jgi:hypothetical protein
MGEILRKTGEALGMPVKKIRQRGGGFARAIAASLGVYEGRRRLRVIARALGLRSGSRLTQLVAECNRRMRADPTLRAEINQRRFALA